MDICWQSNISAFQSDITTHQTLLTAATSDIEHGMALLGPPEPMLDDILKSRDVTLPTKVHLVKAMVFPVVMYG